jgi:hypothetical protein
MLDIVQQIIEARVLTPALETQINHLLWSRALDPCEAEALHKLAEVLLNGSVKYAQESMTGSPSA